MALDPTANRDLQMNEEKLYLRTNIDGYFFDGFINVSQSHTLTVTSHPVQSGANISDHAYKDPVSINAKIIVSDAHVAEEPDKIREARYFMANGATKSMGAFNVLKQLQMQRKLLKVVTPYGSYDNMLLTSLTANYEYKNVYNVIADVTLEEIIVTNEKTVKVSSRAQTTANSSPTPSTTTYNDKQEKEAAESAKKSLDNAAKNSSLAITASPVVTHSVHKTIYAGNYDNLIVAVNTSDINQAEKRMTTASGKTILGVHATGGTHYSVELDTAPYDPSNELDN